MKEHQIEQIISEYEPELRYAAFRYVRNWVVVDDIMQEVFLKIFLKFHSFRDPSKIKAWLYKITRNQCIDYLRSKVVKATVLMDDFEGLRYTTTETVEKAIVEKFDRERLYEHIEALPKDYKQTLSLYYLHDYSYNEISQFLRKDISFVKNKLFRGRRLLKEVYEKELIV
ncbi:sigma-70 family RNA polymerase sigma factor [Bacillus timonensis]|uniref:Sigma-70 family RNA polymerase sigma factor n=1 Tax=Bacillus timonensis TaxID=1033734 RepID=A0A4S3PK26_9BACI|nr:sigma-70 family RNA polymerase sigma factor [Bacillus timonensis]THE09790.1 sigma-70 family RNA polymerase sigma factor [Bacillus timonensis]